MFGISTHAEYDQLLRTLRAIAPNQGIQPTACGPQLMPALGDKVSRTAKTIDVLGRFLLGWYLIETARYFWIGRFGVEVGQLKKQFEAPLTPWTVIAPLQIAVAAVGVFVVIPLLWRGAWAGLAAGLLYWAWGYATNPLHFVIPSSYLASPRGEATLLLWVISFAWMATTLAALIGFFLLRRSIVRTSERATKA